MEFTDNYGHIDSNLIYTSENIISKELETNCFQFTHECSCEDSCSDSKCECVIKFGTNYEGNEKLLNNFDKPIYECNSNCKCPKNCGNRLVQLGPKLGLQITKCTDLAKGFGLTTNCEILKGSFICEYAGEVITSSEALQKSKLNQSLGRMNYILEFHEHFGSRIEITYIDPSQIGNIGRYLNHSCDPNCVLVPVRINETIPKVAIFANQNIAKGSELTFDYGSEKFDPNSENLKPCLCNSVNCKKWLPYLASTEK